MIPYSRIFHEENTTHHHTKAMPSYKRVSPWLMWASVLFAVAVAWPIVHIFFSWLDFAESREHWRHLLEFTLGQVIIDTLLLVMGVTLLSSFLGVSLAWLCSQKEFPARSLFRNLLVLPLGIPAYITAFVYVGLLDYSGPVSSFFREVGWAYPLPEIRSLGGSIFVLSLGLYPYIFFLCLNAFESQGAQLLAAAHTLGASPRRTFWTIALPFSKPFILGGTLLVALEVMNDFGAVSILGVNTLSTSVYKMWFGFFSPSGAAQLASLLLVVMLFFYGVNQFIKGQGSFATNQPLTHTPIPHNHLKVQKKHRLLTILPTVFCSVVFTLSFVIPIVQLLIWTIQPLSHLGDTLVGLKAAAVNTTLVAISVAFCSTWMAFFMALYKRRTRIDSHSANARLAKIIEAISLLGYGVPGTVLAIAIYLPVMQLDQKLGLLFEWITGNPQGMILGGGLLIMIFALTIRMMAVGHSSISSGLERIPTKIDDAASVLGVVGAKQIVQIQLPLIGRAWFRGMILVFVDTAKEMPLTLMTRPLGWDFLSIKIFAFVSEGEWQKAAVPALGLSLVTLLPFLWYFSPNPNKSTLTTKNSSYSKGNISGEQQL